MSNEISEDLRNFIRRNVNSVSLLDLLLFLKKNPEKFWTPEEISVEMRTNPSYAMAQMGELVTLRILRCEDSHRFIFAPSPEDLESIDQLEQLYNSRRSTVINYIYSQPIDSIRDFANAFKIKKD